MIHLPRPQQEHEPQPRPTPRTRLQRGRHTGQRRPAWISGPETWRTPAHGQAAREGPQRQRTPTHRRGSPGIGRAVAFSQRRAPRPARQTRSQPRRPSRRATGGDGAFPTAATPSHMHADSPTLPGVYQWATKKRHMWRTRCSGGKSAGSEHLRAACHRPSMWEGLYPLPTIRDGNTFDKITTLLTGAEMTQGRLA